MGINVTKGVTIATELAPKNPPYLNLNPSIDFYYKYSGVKRAGFFQI